jgi:membrane-bound serine protease (ClpP class)
MDDLVIAYGLILLSLVLLLAELLIYTHGVLSVLSLAAMIVGLTMVFTNSTSTGMGTLIALAVIVPLLLTASMHYWPKTPIGRRIVLHAPAEDDTLATMPLNLELEQLRGRYGRTVSALRPAGITDFDGRRVDTLSEGALIEPGQWVRCIDVKAGRVIVRPVEKPPDLNDLDTAIFG